MRKNWILLGLTFAVVLGSVLRMTFRTTSTGPRTAERAHAAIPDPPAPPSWTPEPEPMDGTPAYAPAQHQTGASKRHERRRPAPSPPRKVGGAMAATVSATRDQVAEAMERRTREEQR